MHQPITHVLVPVDPQDDSQAAQLAALHLACGTNALVTLLHVQERHDRILVTAQLDALSNLHQIMRAPPEDNPITPVYPDTDSRKSIRSLRKVRNKLVAISPDDLQIRVACRRGDPVVETEAFINEAGVDVVMVESPATCKSSSLRRLARGLQQHCSCQLHIVHPPHTKSELPGQMIRAWWKSIASRWQKMGRTIAPSSKPLPSVEI